MNKIMVLILLVLSLVGCSNVNKVDTRISTIPKEGYYRVVVNYENRITDVRLDTTRIESNKEYFVEGGEYYLTYKYNPILSFSFGLNYNTNENYKDYHDNNNSRELLDYQREKIILDKDVEIQLENKNVELNFDGKVGF